MERALPVLVSPIAALWFTAACASLNAAASDRIEAGKASFREQRWADAERQFQAAIGESPNNAQAHKWLGMTYAAQDRLERAEAPFRRACDLAPRDPDACYYLGRTLFGTARFADAELAFSKALRATPANGRVLGGMALVMAALERREEAARYFEKAIAAGDQGARVDYERFRSQPGPGSTAGLPGGAAPIRLEPAGLPFIVNNGARGERRLPETMIGGAAALDYDGDGWTDLFFTSLAGPCGLLRNLGNRTFADATGEAGLRVLDHGAWMGAAAADYDLDGDIDLFLTGVSRQMLLRNDGGRFSDATAGSGLAPAAPWSVSAVWIDYDADRLPDLFVVHYVRYDPAKEPVCELRGIRQYCHPKYFEPLSNSLYRNLGGGRFRDVSAESGIAAHRGKGMGAAVGDANGDGRLDLFVANDALPNFLFVNEGGGRFRERAVDLGAALPESGQAVSSMGAEWRDLDNDGREDILFTALSNETFPLLLNRAQGFIDVTLRSGLARASMPWTGWSLAAIDLDNDGWRDVITANGHVMDNAEAFSGRQSRQPLLLLRNAGGAGGGKLRFTPALLGEPSFYRGLVYADFDRDGRLDVAVTRLNEPALLWWNSTPGQANWLEVEFDPAMMGARVELEASSGLVQSARVQTANGYAGSSAGPLHFGLGHETEVRTLRVHWLSGGRTTVERPRVNSRLRVRRTGAPQSN